MSSMLDEFDSMSEEKQMEICYKADELQKMNLSKKDKAIVHKAAKLIARDYGEVIKKLEEE
jgi:hypothetical protein